VTAVCYTLLLVWYVPLAPEHMHHQHEEAASAFNAHVFGMWATFVLSAVLIAHFVARMASSLRERDHMLAAAREEALRNERIVALGTLAAGAAHELGTPLATMQLIADHLEAQADQCPQFAEDVADLQAQVATCKRIISEMAARAGSARDESAAALPADRFLDDVVDKWRLMRPQAKSAHRWASSRPAPAIYVEPTLYQAVINLFNNAADASPEEVDIVGRADADGVVIEILDRGPGLTAEVQARAGQPFFSTKAPGKGMGIGLFLANATIERNGGRVSIFNREGGGACTRVALPALAGNTGAI
jgi:two-component system sensor histidine kinase RegB